jgi:hypothetical protein
MGPFLGWLETNSVAAAVSQSTLLIGSLSAIHLLGMTVVVGGAFVSSLRLLGIIFRDRAVADVASTVSRGMMFGLALSVTTGLLMFAPRASRAVENSFFQTKMLLLLAATLCHFSIFRGVIRRGSAPPVLLKLTGALVMALWFGVAAAGCAYILLE